MDYIADLVGLGARGRKQKAAKEPALVTQNEFGDMEVSGKDATADVLGVGQAMNVKESTTNVNIVPVTTKIGGQKIQQA